MLLLGEGRGAGNQTLVAGGLAGCHSGYNLEPPELKEKPSL